MVDAGLKGVRDLAFIGLHGEVLSALESREDNADIDSIIAIGNTYLRYAREKRAFFGLMWEDRGHVADLRAVCCARHLRGRRGRRPGRLRHVLGGGPERGRGR